MYKKLFLVTSFVLLASLFLSTVAQASPPAVRHDTNDADLVALWHLDETGGTVAVDSKGGNNTGTLSPGTNTYAWGATGKFGTALTMNTVNTAADNRMAFSLTGMDSTAGSLVMWAKLATQPQLLTTTVRYFTGWQGQTLVGAVTVDRVQLYLANIGGEPEKYTELSVGLGCQNKLDQFCGHMNVGEWYHVALTWNQTDTVNKSGNYQAYLNGIDMPSGTMSTGYTPGTYRNLKGVSPPSGNGQLFNNQTASGAEKNEGGAETLDEVGFYKDAITRAQVCALAGADPNKAWNPTPDNGVVDIGKTNPTLSWSAGAGAASHDVYLGTDSASPTSIYSGGNQTATSIGAGTLDFNKVYYWRIDERDGGGLRATGDLWSFRTVTGKAANPVPDNGSYNARIPVKLAWKAGNASDVCHDIYLGTNSVDVSSADRTTPVFLVKEQAFGTTTYTPNSVVLDKRYYWRIDEVISYPTLFKGDVWTYTTSPIFYADDFQAFASTMALTNAWKGTGVVGNIYQAAQGTDKSVRFFYDNVTSPYYAGIKRSVGPAQGTSRDYTFGGTAKSVRVSYLVGPNNPALYVSLFNGATQSTGIKQPITVAAGEPVDPLSSSAVWNETWFALSGFSGSVTTNVTSIEVGDGNRTRALLGQGYMYIDDFRIQAMEYVNPLEGDVDGSHDVDYNDVDEMIHGSTWLDPPVSLVKGGGMNKGTWGTQPSNQPDNGSDPCSVNWPKYWYLWTGTATTVDANYVLKVDTTDPKTKTCARLDLDGPTTTWNDGDLRQLMDVNEFNNQELLVSFMHKGSITAMGDTMFEYRPCMDGCSTNDRAGAPMLKRVQRGGLTTCGDCYGALSWDWEPYTHIMTVNVATMDNKTRKSRYLHLAFRMGGKAESTANPPMYLMVDSVVVSKVGDTLPYGDLTMDGVGEAVSAIDFTDFAVIANDWLLTQQSIP